jgi:hypothetical protein
VAYATRWKRGHQRGTARCDGEKQETSKRRSHSLHVDTVSEDSTVNEREFYEGLLPQARRVLGALGPEEELTRLNIESVEVAQTDDHGPHIVVLFSDPARPDCRFGWRWSWVEGPRPEEAGFAAGVLVTNFEEDIVAERYGLPEECEPGSITWF